MLVDQGSCFEERANGGLYVHLASIYKDVVEKTGIEARFSLGIGKRYNKPLRQTYQNIMYQNPNGEPQVSLALIVKYMNEKLGPEGLMLSELVLENLH